MISSNFSFNDSKNNAIYTYKWLPDANINIVGVIQIAHGMAEHAGRYSGFAEFLTKNGFVVYANDHLGHGFTAKDSENFGFFSENNGLELVVESMFSLSKIIKTEFPDKPFYLFGHSMGSFLSRYYVIENSEYIDGLILSGTAYHCSALMNFGILVVKMQKMFFKAKDRSYLLNLMSFGSYNSKFKPNRTLFDWICKNTDTVDKFVKDKYSGFVCTIGFFGDLFRCLKYINNKTNILKQNKNLPVLMIAGNSDPVGNFGKGVLKVYKNFVNNGINNITLKLYYDCRHEVLNETNKTVVYNDVLNWIKNL